MRADDTELFMKEQSASNVSVKPNIMILLDSSGSMNTVIQHPNYNPKNTYKDLNNLLKLNDNFVKERIWMEAIFVWKDQYGNKYGYYSSGKKKIRAVSGNNLTLTSDLNGPGYIVQLWPTVATAKYEKNSYAKITISNVRGTFEVGSKIYYRKSKSGSYFYEYEPRGVWLYGGYDGSYKTWYEDNYVRWVCFYATYEELDQVNHFATHGTFDITDPNVYPERFIRMKVARSVVKKFAENAQNKARIGLYKFAPGAHGGEKTIKIKDLSNSTNLKNFKDTVSNIRGSGSTPLGESLADIWKEFKPKKTYWPSDYEIRNGVNHTSGLKPDKSLYPIQWECQKNYVILVTDGASTSDDVTNGLIEPKYRNSIFTEKPVKRTEPWTDWNDGWGDFDDNEANSGWPGDYNVNNPSYPYCPNNTCWGYPSGISGTDYLDDIAYMIAHSDLYPDEKKVKGGYKYWPGEQNINTFVIGFSTNNDMLDATATNGGGKYYTASNYDDLLKSFDDILNNINMREYALAAITAPRKTSSSGSTTKSYLGYFIPTAESIFWEGHVVSYKLIDRYGYDEDHSGKVEEDEYIYDDEYKCKAANGGKECKRQLKFDDTPVWDARDVMSSPAGKNRKLYFNESPTSTTLKKFDLANVAQIKDLITDVDDTQTKKIITEISKPRLADIFHSDVLFVGEPPQGKAFLTQYKLFDKDAQKFSDFYDKNKGRNVAIYTGSNGGMLHMFDDTGKEQWGFIPDEVMPKFKEMVIPEKPKHQYTVDGRLTVEDIAYKSGADFNWHTILTFGLRDGGKAYYTLDITKPGDKPKFMWKFKNETHSANSWGKPAIGKIKLQKDGKFIEKYVVILSGGLKYNHANIDDPQGKALFIVDAATGKNIWTFAYDNAAGAEDNSGTPVLDTNEGTSTDGILRLTKDESMNYSSPADPIAIDKDNDGYIDYVYFGNLGGNLFKCDISANNTENWKPYLLFKNTVKELGQTTAVAIDSKKKIMTVSDGSLLKKGYTLTGLTSKAMGYIVDIDKKDKKKLSIKMLEGTFKNGENLSFKNFNPIFLQPTIAYDQCSRLWVFWGTGDRDRPHSNPNKGKFYAIRDNGQYNNDESKLKQLEWKIDPATNQYKLNKVKTSGNGGWFFEFPVLGEKLFDPVPVVVSTSEGIPVILFNTYNPKLEDNVEADANPCQISTGGMKIYQMKLLSCTGNEEVEGTSSDGRIAGGGVYGNKEYIPFIDKSGEAGGKSDTELDDNFKFKYNGGIIYWQERKR